MANQSTAKIDQDDAKTLLAYNETTGTTEVVRLNAVTNYLEIYAVAIASGTYATQNTAKIDQNHAKTRLFYNETTGLTECARCDSNGNLLVKIVI